MHNLIHCRRGSVAFATVVALLPLIGVVALGVEAGSWYVTKQHAQTAADAAAVAGAWRLVWGAQDYVSVAKTFAGQNGFCDACTPSPKTLQSVSVDTPDVVTVHVTVSQQQPAYLFAVLGLPPVNIGAQATAVVDVLPQPPCILALQDSVSFQGSPTVNSPTCGIASNSTASNAIDFKGNGGSVNAPSYSAGGCSDTGGNQCSATGISRVATHIAPTVNPLSGLDSAIASLKTSDFPDGACPAPSTTTSPIALPAYGAPKQCYYDSFSFQNNQTYTLNGVYFFADGAITIQGNTTITGTATLILLPPKFVNGSDKGASLNISGNPAIQLTAPTNVSSTQVPTALASPTITKLMIDLLIYDPEAWSKNGVNITGNSSSYFNGTVYVPNAPVTYTGNSSVTSAGCFQVIAYAVTFSGDTKLDDTKCNSDGAPTFRVKYVRLVQ
jgi:Flp pilus assembly protein TadG